MDKKAKICVAGHRGLVGSAIVRKLQSEGYGNLLLRTSKELDLRNHAAVSDFFRAKSLNTYSSQQPRLAASWPTIPTRPSSSTTI